MPRNSRSLPSSADLKPRERAALVGFLALLLVVTAGFFLPRGSDPDDGSLQPTTRAEHVARTTAPGPGTVTDEARAEIERVLAESPKRIGARLAPDSLAHRLVRCAEFEEQRYCLGVGWTSSSEAAAVSRAARSTAPHRGSIETTGDLPTSELLARRAAMAPTERRAVEHRELLAAARSVAKVVLLRHDLLGEPLPAGFLERHPEARATGESAAPGTRTTTSTRAARTKQARDYPRRSTVLRRREVSQQRRTYWCGPAAMQMIAWGWQDQQRRQRRWARRLGTTTNGTAITDMVRVTNRHTGYDRERRAGRYVVLDISDWGFRKWMLLQMRHIEEYRAPVVLHPILLKRFFPYLDDDASGHFQVGRGYNKRGDKPARLGYFEPWNQQRFDRSEPFISRVQWRSAYRSYRANKAHPHQNIGV